MAAKVMTAKNNRNVGSHSFEFLGRDEQPTLAFSCGARSASEEKE
jgi:hypothetical protein